MASLNTVERLIADLNTAPWHLGFPAGRAAVIGSDLGRQVWESREGSQLLEYLLGDDTLGRWFSPPPDSAPIELQFMLASVVDRWAASGESAEEFVTTYALEILDTLREPNPVCAGLALAHGLVVDGPVEFPYGLAVAPATPEQLHSLPASVRLSPVDVIRLPRQPAAFLISSTAASRAEFGPFAATTALASARINVERLRTAIWVATGVLPGRGHTFLWHSSPYPAGPFERIPALPEQRWGRDPRESGAAPVDGSLVWQVVARLGVIWGAAEAIIDDETDRALWIANGVYLPPVLESADARTTVLLSYAAIDGLLRNEDDDDSRLIPRVAWLIGASVEDRRSMQKLLDRLQKIRGPVAHGRAPRLADASAAIGQRISADELSARGLFATDDLERTLRTRCLDLFRRVFVAYLWLVIDAEVDPTNRSRPVLQAGLPRKEILSLLERAARNDAAAQTLLSHRIPELAREGPP